ncbi:hypothetical protein ACIQZB_41805 [Streptomyces sp. NPDC097727]|uniref:hypothetical protein n=1 Tax=Streptomyces sp. NPDC097727 TaxID=3366092 RepID=UPI0038008D5A
MSRSRRRSGTGGGGMTVTEQQLAQQHGAVFLRGQDLLDPVRTGSSRTSLFTRASVGERASDRPRGPGRQ